MNYLPNSTTQRTPTPQNRPHDLPLLVDTMDALIQLNPVRIPKYDKNFLNGRGYRGMKDKRKYIPNLTTSFCLKAGFQDFIPSKWITNVIRTSPSSTTPCSTLRLFTLVFIASSLSKSVKWNGCRTGTYRMNGVLARRPTQVLGMFKLLNLWIASFRLTCNIHRICFVSLLPSSRINHYMQKLIRTGALCNGNVTKVN